MIKEVKWNGKNVLTTILAADKVTNISDEDKITIRSSEMNADQQAYASYNNHVWKQQGLCMTILLNISKLPFFLPAYFHNNFKDTKFVRVCTNEIVI